MAQVYGLTAEGVRSKFLPNAPTLSTTTTPTAAAVALIISSASSEVNAIVRSQGIDPADIGATTEAYAFLADLLEQNVHWRLSRAGLLQGSTAGADADQEDYLRKLGLLTASPETYLSDVLTSGGAKVSSHVSELGLSDSTDGDSTDVTPFTSRDSDS